MKIRIEQVQRFSGVGDVKNVLGFHSPVVMEIDKKVFDIKQSPVLFINSMFSDVNRIREMILGSIDEN